LGVFWGVRLRGFGLGWFGLVLFGAVWCAFGLELSGKGVGMMFGTCSVWLAWTVLTFFLYFFEGSVRVGFVALHGIMDSCSFALNTSLVLSLSLLLGGEGDGRRARWLDCLVRNREVRGGSDMPYERIGLFLFFGLFGSGENKRG